MSRWYDGKTHYHTYCLLFLLYCVVDICLFCLVNPHEISPSHIYICKCFAKNITGHLPTRSLIVSQEPGIKFSGTHILESVSFSATAQLVSPMKVIMSNFEMPRRSSCKGENNLWHWICNNITSNSPTIIILLISQFFHSFTTEICVNSTAEAKVGNCVYWYFLFWSMVTHYEYGLYIWDV